MMGKSDLIWDSMLDSYLAGTPYLLRIYFDGKQGCCWDISMGYSGKLANYPLIIQHSY